MRLINTTTLQLAGPFSGAETPPYAILSHTWCDDEPSLQDFTNYPQRKDGDRFLKIKSCCTQALKDGLSYAWVDTVCIDKTSSSELSEAINSMYIWYSKAVVCYAYLEDLSSGSKSHSLLSDLRSCRWFTRGWTLQELIAPKKVLFFNRSWDEVGDKHHLAHELGKITGINCACLRGVQLQRFSIAQRMSWASGRRTTRSEDLAYSVLGIFVVNMPMLYGEGSERAFARLQQEILRMSNDHSIFAWSPFGLARSSTSGLLAPSPTCFADSQGYIPVRSPGNHIRHSVTTRGISISVLANKSRDRILLRCRRSGGIAASCSLPVQRLRTGPNDYARIGPIEETQPHQLPEHLEEITVFLPHDCGNIEFYHDNLVDYLAVAHLPKKASGYFLDNCCPGDLFDPHSNIILAPPYSSAPGGTVFSFRHKENSSSSFLVTIFCYGDNRSGDGMNMDNDFIGVYNNPNQQNIFDFWENGFNSFRDGRQHKLPTAAERSLQGGLDVWTLEDGSFVHVSITRDVHPSLYYVGCARILAGRCWESDIYQFMNWGSFEPYVTSDGSQVGLRPMFNSVIGVDLGLSIVR